MSKKRTLYTFSEEVANTISHGVPALAVLIGMPFMYIRTYVHGTAWDVVGVTVFCISIFLMFLMSTLYHSTAFNSTHRYVFRILDHIFIYVAIAGSYTPIAISIIGRWQGIVIIVLQWLMVLFGILYKSLANRSIPKVSLSIYLIMGWSALLFFPSLYANASWQLLTMIVLGGVLYSAGSFFYAKTSFKYHHMIWHLFVFLGALTHFLGILFYIV